MISRQGCGCVGLYCVWVCGMWFCLLLTDGGVIPCLEMVFFNKKRFNFALKYFDCGVEMLCRWFFAHGFFLRTD